MNPSLPTLSTATLLTSFHPNLKKESYLFNPCQDKEGSFEKLPAETSLKIIKLLTIKELANSKLVSTTWNARENNLSLRLFLATVLKGQQICAKINKTYKKWLIVPKEKEPFFSLIREKNLLHFSQSLFEIGVSSFSKKKEGLELATHFFKQAADKTCAKSQLALSLFYAEQEELKEKDTLFLDYCTKAASQGLFDAQYCLFILYREGFIVEKNLSKALEYLEKTIIQFEEKPHYPDMLYLLGENYKKAFETEEILKEEYLKKAKNCFKISARLGSQKSIFLLAYEYLEAKNPKRNYEKALSYFFKASQAKQIFARFEILKFYAYGIVVKQNKKIANKYFKWLSNLKNINRFDNTLDKSSYFFNLGSCYDQGIGTEVNKEKAFHFFKLAADHKNKFAQAALGSYYIQKQLPIAIDYFRLSLKQDFTQAAFQLVLIYSKIDKNQEEAKKYFEQLLFLTKKSNCSNTGANLQALSYCYFEGLGVAKSDILGNFYLKEAAKEGDALSQFLLCNVYAGRRNPESEKRSKEYFLLLSDKNHPQYTWKIKERYEMIGECYLKGIGVEKDEEEGKRYSYLANSLTS